MPEPGSCCETQIFQTNNHVVKPPLIQTSKPLLGSSETNLPKDSIPSKFRTSRGCPEEERRPGKARVQSHQEYEIKKNNDEQKIALEKAKNIPPGPLGPFPAVEPGENIPFEYWTPLGSLTKTRPMVENFSLSRFSPGEWREHNEKVSIQCQNGIHVAALAGYNADSSLLKAYAETDKNQIDNNLRLNVRAGIIYRWKTELDRTISDIIKEIDSTQEIRRRIMRAKSTLELVENIGKDIKHVRSFRMDIDLVRDNVAEEVLKELLLCEEIKDLYIRLLDQVKMLIEELKTAKQRLEFDWSGKIEAYKIDSDSRGLNSDSNTILWKSGSVRIPPDQSSSSGYEFSAKEIIAEGQTAIERSNALRINVDSIIEKAVRDLRYQADRIDLTLTEQIQLQEQSVRRLNTELNKDLHQLSDTEALIEEMRNASRRLDGALKCAQTRLDNRLIRFGVESCRDIPQFGLLEEVKSIAENSTVTLGQMKRADDSTKDLIQTRRNIERELVIKIKSLHVDRERCKLLRSFYPSIQNLAGN